MTIKDAKKSDYSKLISIWESSVRATHTFLPEKYIVELKPMILKHDFDAVRLVYARTENQGISGFIGVADNHIEMLFVSPQYFGQGIGKALMTYAFEHLNVTNVDVNEQNPKAIGFYEQMGFIQIGRSELDGQGNPFPLIHMEHRGV